ncbi:DUF4148 domain-containing protein [Caballeronia sp. HLA56]
MKPAIRLAALAAFALSAAASAQTMDPAAAPQAMPMPTPMTMAANTPLSRAEVRADLARARADGTIPRYGNPDPYGPARSARGVPGSYPRS